MQVVVRDFNGADAAVAADYTEQWADIEDVLEAMPLHLKASDQARIQGTPIFDAVGTNSHIKQAMVESGWSANIPIPAAYRFLGTDVDFGTRGVVAEVQFSNYPFLLNNLMRSELLYKTGTPLDGEATGLLVVITKAHMFPASQSTLYFEQAASQVDALANNGVFDIPIRLVGLFEAIPTALVATWTTYHAARYSRTVVTQEERPCLIEPGPRANSRARLTLLPATP